MTCMSCGADGPDGGYATPEAAAEKWNDRAALAQAQPAILGWVNEDELPEGYPYDAMFQHSKVDIVRMFPVFGPGAQAQPSLTEARAHFESRIHEIAGALFPAMDSIKRRADGLYLRTTVEAAWRGYRAAIATQAAQPELQRRFDELLKVEHALSESYVRVREIIGAMDPPALEAESLYAYVEDCARKLAAQPVQAQGVPTGMVQAMKDAIEGECDGLAISDAHAKAILEYVLAAAPQAAPQQAQRVPAWTEADALALCRHDGDGPVGQDDVDQMLRLLRAVDQLREQKAEALAPQQAEPLVDAQISGGEFEANTKYMDLADRIDHEQNWRKSGICQRDNLTKDQQDRVLAGVILRRYAGLMAPSSWRLFPPRGGISFRASSLDSVIEMARKDEAARGTKGAK